MGELPAVIKQALTPDFLEASAAVNSVTMSDIERRLPLLAPPSELLSPEVRAVAQSFLLLADIQAQTGAKGTIATFAHTYAESTGPPVYFRGGWNHAPIPTVGFNDGDFQANMRAKTRQRDLLAISLIGYGLRVGIEDGIAYAGDASSKARIGSFAKLKAFWA